LHPQIPGFQNVSWPNIVLSKQTTHQWRAYLYSFQMKSQFQNIYPCDWFCGPRPHVIYKSGTYTLNMSIVYAHILLLSHSALQK